MANKEFLNTLKRVTPNELQWRIPYIAKRKELIDKWDEEGLESELRVALESENNKEGTRKLFSNALKSYPMKLEEFINYYVLGQHMNHKEYPDQPYYKQNYKTILEELTEQKVATLENEWIESWNEERKNKYLKSKNVLYAKDYAKEWLECTKHPVIGAQSLSHFYDDLYFRISKSHLDLKLETQTFMQTMYAFDKNGKLMRFVKVIEINPFMDNENQMFDWSISIKAMPKDDPKLSSCILRFDSKRKAHDDAHFHLFTRKEQLLNLGRVTCQPITLKKVIALCKEEHEETPNYPPFIHAILSYERGVRSLEKLQNELIIADRKIKKDRMCKYKDGWFRKLACLKYTNTLIDVLMNIEKEQTLEQVKNNLYMIDDEPILSQDEYFEQLINCLKEKKKEDRLLSAEDELQEAVLKYEEDKNIRNAEIDKLEEEVRKAREIKKQHEREKKEVKRKALLVQEEKTKAWLEKMQQQKANNREQKSIKRVDKWKTELVRLESLDNPTKEERRQINELRTNIANARRREEKRLESQNEHEDVELGQ